ncbi:hypothetical protein [Clostridium sp.]|uniref:hypothetical protein n=1 Tax=Clostridium sp. TaxID=1506 RepID=UPI0032172376
MKRSLITLLCVGVIITMVGCGKSDKTMDNNSGDSVQVEDSNQVNIDIRDTAIQIECKKMTAGEWDGEKVFALGTISSIDTAGLKYGNPTFILSQEEGEEKSNYLIVWEMGKLNFETLNLSEGEAVKIYGIVDGEDENGTPIIKTSLIDHTM